MKSGDLVTILAGGVLAFIAWKILAPATGSGGSVGGIFPKLINTGNTSGTIAEGWKYYSDGTAIAPNGDYYYQGSLVYKAQP